MTTKFQKNGISFTAALSTLSIFFQYASAAIFEFNITNAGESVGKPADDGQTFQQQWGTAANWKLVSGEDDGDNGYPDGADTAIINRSALANNSTRLTEEGSPASLVSIGKVIGTGTGNQDIVLKMRAFTFGEVECLESPEPFHIRAERDRSITISGVISGAGSLLLSRSGGLSDGVDEDELITITGDTPNTITGKIRLFNDNNKADKPQPSYWVADKEGAFGQASILTIEGRAGASGGIASLRITENAAFGEGAIDDNATTVFIGAKGVVSVDSGVNEAIGEGLLFTDSEGTGIYTEVPIGTYDNNEAWIIGEGTVTVGAPSAELTITAVDYATNAEGTTLSLTWNSRPGRFYAVRFSPDLKNWDFDLDDGVVGDDGNTTTTQFDLTDFPEISAKPRVFFRIEEVTEVRPF